MKENWFPSITQEDEQSDAKDIYQDRPVSIDDNSIEEKNIELAAIQNRLVQLLKKITPIERASGESMPAEVNEFERSHGVEGKEQISSAVPVGTIMQNSVAPSNKEYLAVQMASAQSIRLASSRVKNQEMSRGQKGMYSLAIKIGFSVALAIWAVGLSIYIIKLWR